MDGDITTKMVAVGALELDGFNPESDDVFDAARRVYRTMELERRSCGVEGANQAVRLEHYMPEEHLCAPSTLTLRREQMSWRDIVANSRTFYDDH